MMYLLSFLIIFPLAAAAVLLFLKNETLRSVLVKISALVIGFASVALFVAT